MSKLNMFDQEDDFMNNFVKTLEENTELRMQFAETVEKAFNESLGFSISIEELIKEIEQSLALESRLLNKIVELQGFVEEQLEDILDGDLYTSDEGYNLLYIQKKCNKKIIALVKCRIKLYWLLSNLSVENMDKFIEFNEKRSKLRLILA